MDHSAAVNEARRLGQRREKQLNLAVAVVIIIGLSAILWAALIAVPLALIPS